MGSFLSIFGFIGRLKRYIFSAFFAFVGAAIAIGLVSCGEMQKATSSSQSQIDIEESVNLGFETVHSIYEMGTVGGNEHDIDDKTGVQVHYLREKLTDVMYVWRTTAKQSNVGGYSYWSSGMTVLLNPETGGPMLYEDWIRLVEKDR